MSSPSSTSTLPLEIFGCIIDNVGHRKPGTGNMPSAQLEILQSCALTCTSLASLCQAHIFKQIDLLDYPGEVATHQQRLLRLVDVLVESPHLAHHIRDFKAGLLTLGNLAHQDNFSSTQFEKVRTALLSLPNLQRLRLPGHPFIPVALSERWKVFGNNLINNYVAQRTLDCIHIGFSLGVCPFNEILSSVQFHTLEIAQIDVPPIHFPISYLTSLNVHTATRFPLSFLSGLPYLESLELSNIVSFATGPPDTRFPSFKLKKLVLKIWDTPQFFDFYLSKARAAKTEPFSALKILLVPGKTRGNMDAIQSLKCILPSLSEFDLDASDCSDVVVPLRSLNLSYLCRSCKTISLDLTAEPFAMSYNRTMEEIISLFLELSSSNALQVLRITINSEISDFELPSSEHWSRLADVFAISSNFPNLRFIEVFLFLTPFSATVSEWDIVKEFETDVRKEELGRHITDAMVALSYRPEVRYHGQIFVDH